jgi:hypothetical protein
MRLEQFMYLTLSFLQTKHLANGDQWKEGYTVIENRALDDIYKFPPSCRLKS